MATALRVSAATMEPAEAARYGPSWFKVWFEAGPAEGEDRPHIDFHVIRASNPTEARCAVERYERNHARMLGSRATHAPESIHATSVEVLPDHAAGVVDG